MPVLLRYKDQDIIDGLDKTINPSLYGHYSASFRRAVDVTFKQDSDSGLSDRLRANAARFAAHKAAYVQRTLQNIQADPQIEDKPKACKQALRVFDNWQDAEYNTAVARARTAKQFEEFNDPESLRLFPNLRWVPSRSANPRATHVAFYDKVWAKDDAFWSNHAPGTEWNCKCDIEETDDPVTDNSGVPLPKVPKGLEGNPAETGELFTDKASYVAKTQSIPEVREFVDKILHWHDDFIQYKHDPDYSHVEYDYNSGGMIAVHKGHQLHESTKEERYFEGLTAGQLEVECGQHLMRAGYKVEFQDETLKRMGIHGTWEILPQLDIKLDNNLMDIRSVTTNGKLESHLSYKNKQLGNVKKKTGVHADSLCLYFHKPEYFTEDKMLTAISRYKGWTEREQRIKHVYIVRNGISEVLKYDI